MNAPLHGSSVGDPQTVLIRVSGPDRPGINAGLMAVLDTCDASVQDIEQIVIRGQISLGVVVDVPAGRDLLRNVCLLYTSPSPRDRSLSRMPSSA